MQAQMENVHLAPYPYLADPGDPTALWWKISSSIQLQLAHTLPSGAYVFFHAIGSRSDNLGNAMV